MEEKLAYIATGAIISMFLLLFGVMLHSFWTADEVIQKEVSLGAAEESAMLYYEKTTNDKDYVWINTDLWATKYKQLTGLPY